MRTKGSIILFLVIFTGLITSPAVKANLLSKSDTFFGLDAITLDTRTGLAWLDLSISAGFSYQQTLIAQHPGGYLSGFRYATESEVLGLWSSAGIAGPGEFAAPSGNAQAALSLMTLIGSTSSQDGNPETIGICDTPFSPGVHYAPMIDFFYNGGIPYYSITTRNLAWGDTTQASTVGSWLVQVPEPATNTLVFGLAMISYSWRKKALLPGSA